MIKQKSNVVVDVGNSQIKVAIFSGDVMIEKWIVQKLSEVTTLPIPEDSVYIFGSVKSNLDEIEQLFVKKTKTYLSHLTPLPIALNYLTPETLGVDRVAAAVAGYHLYPTGCLVIDAGSCITYDYITEDGQYKGGAISPGLKMRMQAMAHFTDQLPDISEKWLNLPEEQLGRSTRGCLVKGAYEGIMHEMDGFIDSFKKENPHLVVVMTGGDAKYFESRLKAPIFAHYDLVLKGLNSILNYK